MAWRSFSNLLVVRNRVCVLGAFLLTMGLAACGSTQATVPTRPGERAWVVKAHQREYLADRIMRPDADAQERAADHHVLVTREGTIGGSGTVGGGCGCN